jgi:hypothetical protein
MAGRRTLGSRVVAGGALGALAVTFGCTQIFGFQPPGTLCHLNSDCPDNDVCSQGACTPQCNASRDCAAGEVCSDRLCRLEGDAAVVDEMGDTAPVDGASADGDAACGDLTSDPDNCGVCGARCAMGVCEDARCLDIHHFGLDMSIAGSHAASYPVGPTFADGTQGQMAGVQIYIDHPGWIVQIGMLAFPGGANGYVGLYTDEGGQPGTLAVSSDEISLSPRSTAASPVPTVVSIRATEVEPNYYWVVGTWQTQIFFVLQGLSDACPDGGYGCKPMYEFPDTPFGPLPTSAARIQSLQLAPIPIFYAGVAE